MSDAATCHAAWLELVGDILQRQPGAREFPHPQMEDLLRESFDAACCSLHVVDGARVDHVVFGWPDGYLPEVPAIGVLPVLPPIRSSAGTP